ncbi:MAG: erythromycin esterase family protein, partial [Gemmatimonadota bacterium]
MEPRNLVRRLVPAGATLWLTVIAGLPLASACDRAREPVEPELSWLETHAVPIATPDPDIPDAALAALRSTIGDARIVGMGEATHGTTEFWQIRQKLSRYLMEEMGFTAILHEAPFPNALYIDRYVTDGEGSALEAHRKLGYWRYQEMQDLIAWIREHNLQRAEGEPALHYFGYDCAFMNWTESINLLAEYLGRVDPDVVGDVTTRLNNYTLEDARYAVDLMTANADGYQERSSPDEYALMSRVAENLEPSWQVWYNLQHGIPELDVRESFNIANVNWIIEHLLDGGKVIIWAHDGHVGNTYLENAGTQAQMLGSRL